MYKRQNQSNVPFDVDYITWKIVDKKVAKRTAVQEQIILPLRAQNYATLVPGKKSERTVFTMAKFTIPDDKCLVVELNEKNGGRHQSFVIENEDLVRANTCLLYTSISSPVVKESIINNSDCKILLDQRKYMNKFDAIDVYKRQGVSA